MPGRTSFAMPLHGSPLLNAEEVGLHLVRAGSTVAAYVAEDVEEPDQDARQEDRPADRPLPGRGSPRPSGAAASKPTNARRQKTMPWSAGLRPPSAGMKTDSVFREPALMISSERDADRKIPISIRPRATPTRVEIEMPTVDEPPDDEPAQDRERQPQVVVRRSRSDR